VEQNWESLKAAEKLRGSVLDGIPVGLPALALADKTLGRAAQVGATVPEPSATGADGAVVLGDRLLGLVAEGRAAGVDPEQALRDAVRRLADLVRAAER
jgi:XTP/dITP diphosphohydrolase